MDKKAALKIVDRFRREIEARGIKTQKIILYGSFANGTQSEESDIDLVIVSDDFSQKDYWERIDILSEAIYEVFAPIEAVAMTTEEWERGDSFIADFATNGEVLYAA
jgi:predicted nucleotidyltransferase